MKKVFCAILSLVFLFLLGGCEKENTESLKFHQQVTIVKMPSPPKCKITDSISVVNDVIEILNLIEKSPISDEKINGGWSTMIKLKIDDKELVYTLGDKIFTDADGKQYTMTNGSQIQEKISKIYNKIEVPEVDYP